jgi:hypothetical protein
MPKLWAPENFDPRIAEQQKEMRHLYGPLGMTVALPNSKTSLEDDTHESVAAQVGQAMNADNSTADASEAPVPTSASAEAAHSGHLEALLTDEDTTEGALANVAGYY